MTIKNIASEPIQFVKKSVNKFKNNYSDEFLSSVITLKLSLVIAFALITIVYIKQQKKLIQNDNINVYTMLHSDKYFKKLLIACSFDAAAGIITFLFVIFMRDGMSEFSKNIIEKWHEILLVGFVLFLFRFSQESSGMNRWLGEYEKVYQEIEEEQLNDIINKNGTNVDIAKIRDEFKFDVENMKTLKEKFKDPFESAVGNTAMALKMLFISYFMLKIIMSAVAGFFDGKYGIKKSNISIFQFCVELLIIGIINYIPSILEPGVFGEKIETKSTMMALCMAFASMTFHFMSQYTGLYSSYNKPVL